MVLEEVPPWVNLTQKERVEWLNVVLETLWPYMKVIEKKKKKKEKKKKKKKMTHIYIFPPFPPNLLYFEQEATEQTLKSSLTTILEQYKPDFLSALYFERLNLGDTPPLIQYIDTGLGRGWEERG